jgi:hypothetical protein
MPSGNAGKKSIPVILFFMVFFQLSITFRFNPFNISSLYKVILFKHLSLPSRIVKQLVLLSEKASFTMIKAILIDTKQVVLFFKMISLLSKMLILTCKVCLGYCQECSVAGLQLNMMMQGHEFINLKDPRKMQEE